jgi:hypothetical protein
MLVPIVFSSPELALLSALRMKRSRGVCEAGKKWLDVGELRWPYARRSPSAIVALAAVTNFPSSSLKAGASAFVREIKGTGFLTSEE